MKRMSLLSALLPVPAFAHTGDHGQSGLLHLLTEPDHLALRALGAAFVIYVLVKRGARR